MAANPPPAMAELDSIAIAGRQGQVVARFAAGITLYVPWGGDPAQAAAMGQAAQALLTLIGSDLRWIAPTGDDFQPARTILPTLDIAQRFATVGMRQASFLAHDGERPDDAGANSLAIHVPRAATSRKLGSIVFTIGLARLQTLPAGQLRQTVLSLATMIQPLHGTCGLCLALPPNPYAARDADPEVVPFLQRFPGLAFDHPASDRLQLRTGFKCVNWITVLGDALVERLGGAAKLGRAAHDAGLGVEPFAGGIIVQAGPAPELGDRTLNLFPEAYRRAGMLLKPARAPFDDVIFDQDMGDFDADTFSREWLGRFDG